MLGQAERKFDDILSKEIKNIKEHYPRFELKTELDGTRTPVLKRTQIH